MAGRTFTSWHFSVFSAGCCRTTLLVSIWIIAACLLAVTGAQAVVRHYTIAVHISTDRNIAGGPEEALAIREFVERRVEAINRSGGIQGRRVRLRIFDDESQPEKTRANVEAALADPMLIAMIGVWNSTRGAGVVDAVGRSGVPFISEMSVESLFSRYPNIYTLTRSVHAEQNSFSAFARDGFKRVVFVGGAHDAYTRDYEAQLRKSESGGVIGETFWHDGTGADDDSALDRTVARIKAGGADLVFLSLGSVRGARFLDRMRRAGLSLPVFVGLGSINGIIAASKNQPRYEGALYEIAEGGIANLNNERLEQLMRGALRRQLMRSYSPYAIGYGARYGDLVQLVSELAAAGPAVDPVGVRGRIAAGLSELKAGRNVWRGTAQDWSFTAERASAERSLLIWLRPGEASPVLAPYQYVPGEAGVAKIPVIYVHMDLVRLHRVDSDQKSFEAEFYFTLRSSSDIDIGAIEFTNASQSPESGAAQVQSREVHAQPAGADRAGARIYRVTGRFTFDPDLTNFPFDEQVFSISFQPASTAKRFFLQPPPEAVRDRSFLVDGWQVRNHYVGTRELIVETISGPFGERSVLPYYNFNYTWVMERQVVDYLLRVVVPLGFIIVVAYLANFIPRAEFEAIIAIQVTALLSAIALYLALNQPSSDVATLSDHIFVTAYAVISAMIALSILEVNTTLIRYRRFLAVVTVLQVYLVPLFAVVVIATMLSRANVAYDILAWVRHLARSYGGI
ncbi:MAG: hypothetical protein RLZ98_2173 [Pseudomonadota bacterium]|jgi:hypothetical protein